VQADATASPALSADQAVVLHLGKNRFQELDRNCAPRRDCSRRQLGAGGKGGNFQQGLERVTGFLADLCRFGIGQV
jgi:hypothetical protein